MAGRRRPSRGPWLRLAAAAAVAAGIGLVVQTLYLPSPPAPPSGDALRGGTVEAVAPLGDLAEPPSELRWRAVAGAAAYRVRVETVTGSTLWEARVAGEATRAELPALARAGLQRAVRYAWTVEALDRGGAVIGASDGAWFRVRPRATEGGGVSP